MTKRSRILIVAGVLIVVIGVVVVAFVLIGRALEPMDTFPRAQLTANCPNNTSVVLYQRKTRWFASDTEWSVKQFDSNGKSLRGQLLFTTDRWNDSEMHRRPEEFCGDEYWPRT